MIKKLGFVASGIIVLGLTACGGSNTTTSQPASGGGGNLGGGLSAKITGTNAELVAARATTVNDSFLGTGAAVGGELARSLSVPSSSTGLLSVLRSQVLNGSRNVEGTVAVPSRAARLGEVTTVCEGGGTQSVNFSDPNSNTELDVGETLALVYVNCVAAGETLNGAMNITTTSKDGDPSLENSNYSIGATIATSNFSITDSDGTVSHNGQIVFLLTHTPTTDTTTVNIPTFTVLNNGITDALSNFTITSIENLATSQYSVTVAGLVNNSVDGTFRVSTPTPLQGVGDGDPTLGVLKIEGVTSSMTVNPLSDGQQVRLDIDSNGDGITDSSINTTWAQLDNA